MPSAGRMTSLARYQALPREDAMEEAIRELTEGYRGGKVFHIRNSSKAPEMEGFPDLVIISPPWLAIVELKSQEREVTVGQRRVLTLLEGVTRLHTGIVRPEPHPGETGYAEFLELLKETG